MPRLHGIDFGASCFCHKVRQACCMGEQHPVPVLCRPRCAGRLLTGAGATQRTIALGFVCSVCLSVFCSVSPTPCVPHSLLLAPWLPDKWQPLRRCKSARRVAPALQPEAGRSQVWLGATDLGT